MLEIVFNDSACGSLKAAQHYGEGKYTSSCTGIAIISADGGKPTKKEIRAARREAEVHLRKEWESATPLGGNSADVYDFSLILSVGDISDDVFGEKRQKVFERLWGIYPKHIGEPAYKELFQRCRSAFQTVCECFENGEKLRIWYSNQPDEACGMYWLAANLPNLEERFGQISLIKLPNCEADGDAAAKHSWGEVSPGEWHRYLPLETAAPFEFFRSCAEHWQSLRQENTPLRAVLNGRLVGVPETFYDYFITRELEAMDDKFQEATVIGRILGKYHCGIGDAWIALRIEEMIRREILQPITTADENSPSYHRILKKCE